MKKNVMIVVIVLVIIATSLMYFFQSRDVLKQTDENLPATDQADTTSKKSAELHDLKNSIGNVIDDSVQEDIQKAVEDEVLKTAEPKK